MNTDALSEWEASKVFEMLQVFHLCHTTGEKESFMCPQGMRFDVSRSQCVNWSKVPCDEHRWIILY